jgi:Cellulase M and related proteins
MLDTTKTLCALKGVSGWEDEVRDYILKQAEPLCHELYTDALGNLMFFKKGRQAPDMTVMLCAHMDEVGLIVTDICDSGYLKFDFIGGVDRRVVIGKRITVGPNSVPGIISIKAIHLTSHDEENTIPETSDMYIDIGADSKDDALKQVSLGDCCVFDSSIYEYGDGFIKAKALDDRAGCAALLELMKTPLAYDCWFVFTSQEEIGTRGAAVAAHRINPDIALVLEGTTAADLPQVSDDVCRLGDGLVIPFMDRGAVYDRELYSLLTRLAGENGIKWQTKRKVAGGTDGSAIQKSRCGVKTAVIAVPLRSIHTPACTAKTAEIEALPVLAQLFLSALGELKHLGDFTVD